MSLLVNILHDNSEARRFFLNASHDVSVTNLLMCYVAAVLPQSSVVRGATAGKVVSSGQKSMIIYILFGEWTEINDIILVSFCTVAVYTFMCCNYSLFYVV